MLEFKVYGMTRYNYQYIANEYPEDIKWDKDKIKIFTLDLECECEHGFLILMLQKNLLFVSL